MASTTLISASHTVDPNQQEPGKPADQQAFHHDLNLVFAGLTLNARYGVNDRWGVGVNVPVRGVHITAGFRDANGADMPSYKSIHHRTELIAGLGDVRISGHYRALKGTQIGDWTFDLLLGATLPTGNTEPDPFALGERGEDHQHMFFGHGTVDPIVGFELSRRGSMFRFQAFGNARLPFFENGYGFRGARTIAAGVGVDSDFGLKSWRFVTQAGAFIELPAAWSGVRARNSGRTDVTLTAGVNYLLEGGAALVMMARLPINVAVAGGQMNLGPVITFGYATSAGFE